MTTAMDRVTKVPISDLTTPPRSGMYNVHKDDWWTVVDECLLFYRQDRNSFGSPQCNHDERTCRIVNGKLYPGSEIRQIPLVFVPMRRDDHP